MRLQSPRATAVTRHRGGRKERRGFLSLSLSPPSSLFSHSCLVVLRLRANEHRPWISRVRVYIPILCAPTTSARAERERETERKGERKMHTCVCVYVGTTGTSECRARTENKARKRHRRERGGERDEKRERSDVFRPNYAPPLAVCRCCRGSDGAAGRQARVPRTVNERTKGEGGMGEGGGPGGTLTTRSGSGSAAVSPRGDEGNVDPPASQPPESR